MTLAVLVLIAVMWIPVAFTNLGQGEGKSTGFAAAMVGGIVVISAILQAAVFKDAFTAGLLFAHGILYCCIAHALLTGVEDLRTVANVSLTVAIISAIYMLIWWAGPEAMRSSYFGFCAAGYTVLTLEVWGAFYGKFSAKLLALSLLAWAVIGLWIPAFLLMMGKPLPF
jgi:hypothetical protein